LLTNSVDSPIETIALDVSGMKCAGCVKAVEQQLMQQSGVVSATVNLVTEVAIVSYEPVVDPQQLAQTLTDAGFPTQPRYLQGETDVTGTHFLEKAEHRQQVAREQIRQLTIAALLLFLSALGHLGQWGWITVPGLSNIWFHAGLATLALLAPGRSMLVDGWQGARRNAPNMNTLVSLGTLTAYLTSMIALLFPQLGWECFFDEPVMLVGFILLGRTLEQRARTQAASAFEALLALQPRVARLIPVGNEPSKHEESNGNGVSAVTANYIEIPVDRVKQGEWLQVLPGDKIPVDGEVVAGQTTIDEAMLTGEPMPVLKQPGDFVAAGTLNQSGAIALKATRVGKETTLAQIIALVEAAQTRKAPIQNLADQVAGYFTYGVLAIAVLTFGFWYFIGTHLFPNVLMAGGHWVIGSGHAMMHQAALHASQHPTPLLFSLKLAIAVLVVACPCALGLATPTAILVGTGIGAEQGLLIRGGDVLEKVHHLDTIVFDKTGTLTIGKPTVTDCISLLSQDWLSQELGVEVSLSPAYLLQVAASVEVGTRHPLANAIQQAAQQQAVALLSAQQFHTEPGFGVSAQVALAETSGDGKPSEQRVVLGTLDWLAQHDIWVSEAIRSQAAEFASAGKTVVYLAIAGKVAGLIAVADVLRDDAKMTVAQLQQMGLRVMMLTGNRWEAATHYANAVGLEPDNVLAEILPGDKAKTIAQLQAQGHRVAMVGDGINDAPALAQADVGIALGSATEVAMETAEIILMRDRLLDVVKSIRLSRATFNKIRQNLFWAFAYNTLGIPAASGALLPVMGIALSPAVAGAMMAFSSVSVVTNSLLLRRVFPIQLSKKSTSPVEVPKAIEY
jgi:P-type Cu2+ transporter